MTDDEAQAELLDHAHGRTADRSKLGRTSRRRGADAERQVVAYLRANGWPDARRYLAGDGRQPGDLDWHPLICCEVKDRKDTAWPTWCRQATTEARPGMIPMVVRRTRTGNDVGAWECRVDLCAWIAATDLPFVGPINPEPPVQFHMLGDREWLATPFAAAVHALAWFDRQDAV